ncbi:MAG: hypothetical protein R2939_00010, partial [Kofleriaceae bacterium]
MRARLLSAALVALGSVASAQELPVWIDAPDHPSVAARVALELQALGHASVASAGGETRPAVIRIRAREGRLYARIEAPGVAPVEVALDPDAAEHPAASALRVAEGLRAALIPSPASTRSPPAPAPAPALAPRVDTRRWLDDLRVAVAAGASFSPSGGGPVPVLHLRLAWERAPWVELVGDLALASAEFGAAARLRVSTASLGLGAPLVQGPRGALGVSLRVGLALVDLRDASEASGVVGAASGALTGRVSLWRRLSAYGALAVGTTLAAVTTRTGVGEPGEWGR